MTNECYDVLIIGGGPAGLSAALWCKQLGLEPVVIEKNPKCGGQLLWTHNEIRNYLGVCVEHGAVLAERFTSQVTEQGVPLILNSIIKKAELKNRSVNLEDGGAISGGALIVATGIRRRSPDLPEFESYIGRGILQSGKKDAEEASGKVAVVVGGGDAAFENAIILSSKASRVILVHRSDKFRARPEFVAKAKRHPGIEIITGKTVARLSGENELSNVVLRNEETEDTTEIDVEAVLFRIGVLPNSELVTGQLDLDADGYIPVDRRAATAIPGVWAVGDVANPESPTISTATGTGATAAKAIFSWIRR